MKNATTIEPSVLPTDPALLGTEEAIAFLSATGEVTGSGAEHGIDIDLARDLYRAMVRARRFDTAALALQRQGELGLWLMSLGQEAAQVGSILALRPGDYVFPSYRDHAAALCRGITPRELLAQWRGVNHAGWDPSAHSFHIYSLVLGTQTLHATGYAMGVQRDKSDQVVMTYFGDGATSQGDVSEALNWAATARLPIVFFCQNNHWAISTPTSLQHATPLHVRAAGFGMRNLYVDGNDALAVHAVTKKAAEHARAGEGPVFVEAVTYRMAGHSTSDDPTRYRAEEERAEWQQRDPISRLRAFLTSHDGSDDFAATAEAEADDIAREAREACQQLTEPPLAELFDEVYAAPHPVMDRQKAEHLRFRATLPGGGK